MAKKDDGIFALLLFLGLIIKWLIEYWLLTLIVVIIILSVIYFNYLKEKKYNQAISLSEIDSMQGIAFEHYISKLLKNEGFSSRVTRASNDYGVDIIASKKDKKYAIQVKRSNSNISRRAISDAVAGMKMYKCNYCMVITNGYFSKAAIQLADVNSCKLIDRDILKKWIVNFQQLKSSS